MSDILICPWTPEHGRMQPAEGVYVRCSKCSAWARTVSAASVIRAIETVEVERDRLLAKVREYEAWADSIAHDERVEGWVHQESYGLYCLLADPEIELEPTLKSVLRDALDETLEPLS